MEIVLHILSYFQCEAPLNVSGRDVYGIWVAANGILPYLILKPGLLPPYCNEGKDAYTLDELTEYNTGPYLELEILTDADVLRTVELDVGLDTYPEIEVLEDKLHSLFQAQHRIRHIFIGYDETADIVPMLSQVKFCLPHN